MRFEIAQNFLRRNLDLLGRRLGGNSEGEIMLIMIIIMVILSLSIIIIIPLLMTMMIIMRGQQ